MTLTKAKIMEYPDGTWIETDSAMTQVLNTWPWNTHKPTGTMYLWRRNQLLDQLTDTEERNGSVCQPPRK